MADIRKVLIIDDDEVNNFICVRQIRAANFAEKAEFELLGHEALQNLSKQIDEAPDQLPDVIFLDINMPMMNAWDFLKEYESLRERFPKEIKLFILSSSVYSKDQKKALNHAAVVDYLYKPLTKELLQQVRDKYFS